MAVAYEQKNAQSGEVLDDYDEKCKNEEHFDIEEYLFFIDIFNTV